VGIETAHSAGDGAMSRHNSATLSARPKLELHDLSLSAQLRLVLTSSGLEA